MKTTTVSIIAVIALIVGAGVGYSLGMGSDNSGDEMKKLQDATTMMKEQSASIQKMGEMMVAGGVRMQEMGMKLKDDTAVAQGKDLEAVGKKYVEENAKAAEKDSSMSESMN